MIPGLEAEVALVWEPVLGPAMRYDPVVALERILVAVVSRSVLAMPTEEYAELAEWSMYVAQKIFPRRRRGIREPTLLFKHAKRTGYW